MKPEQKFYEHLEDEGSPPTRTLHRVYCCLCCGYPASGGPGSYDICSLCSWEDDGFDGYGANGDYSLKEAQENFEKYLTMYRPSHEIAPRFQREGFRHVHDRELQPWTLDYKRRLIELLKLYMAEEDLLKRGDIWKKIRVLE